MIDQILSRKSSPSENEMLTGFTPQQAITEFRLLNESADRLTVIFPPWHGAGEVMRKLEKRLIKRGWAVLSYDFHDHILEPNAEGVLRAYHHVASKISKQIQTLQKQHNYKQTHLLSISLGIVSLMLVASKLKSFDRASIALGGSSFASCLWYGIRTQRMRKAFEAQGVGLDTLKSIWKEIEPSYNAPALKDKDVHLYISSSDLITPLRYAEEFHRDVLKAGANVSVQRLKLGHAMSIIKFCLLPSSKLHH